MSSWPPRTVLTSRGVGSAGLSGRGGEGGRRPADRQRRSRRDGGERWWPTAGSGSSNRASFTAKGRLMLLLCDVGNTTTVVGSLGCRPHRPSVADLDRPGENRRREPAAASLDAGRAWWPGDGRCPVVGGATQDRSVAGGDGRPDRWPFDRRWSGGQDRDCTGGRQPPRGRSRPGGECHRRPASVRCAGDRRRLRDGHHGRPGRA